jgi:hypothetical protein
MAAAMPAIIAERAAATSRAAGSGTAPTVKVRAASPCQPSTMAPASMDTSAPSRTRRVAEGMPCTTSASIETQIECRKAPLAPGTPMNDGVPPAARTIDLGDGIELQRRHARADGRLDGIEDVGHQAPGDRHALDLRGALEGHPSIVEGHRGARQRAGWAIARISASVTDSIDCSPSTAVSTPRSV